MPIRGYVNPFPPKLPLVNTGIFSGGKSGSQKMDPQPSTDPGTMRGQVESRRSINLKTGSGDTGMSAASVKSYAYGMDRKMPPGSSPGTRAAMREARANHNYTNGGHAASPGVTIAQAKAKTNYKSGHAMTGRQDNR